MLIKPSTIVTSALLALLHQHKGVHQRQLLFAVAVIAMLTIWKLCAALRDATHPQGSACETSAPVEQKATVRWSYDELAHKLIIQNTDLAYSELDQGFTQRIGRSLSKVARHIDGKPVIVNL
ncbi:hypothetical protein [Dyadobacter sp. 676]|uniref:Uncharacterized protein n=1 Tax=Dyadobacter sp. 676 TaxID=3088362 RepID=A0AAU8FLN2_9BACT